MENNLAIPSKNVRDLAEEVGKLYNHDSKVGAILRGVWQLTTSDEYLTKIIEKMKGFHESENREEKIDKFYQKVFKITYDRDMALFEAICLYSAILSKEEMKRKSEIYYQGSSKLAIKLLDELIGEI